MAQPQNSGLPQPMFIKMIVNVNQKRKHFFPFDIQDPEKYFSCVFSLRQQFNIRNGDAIPVRYLGSGINEGRALYIQYERDTLYGMKLTVDDQDWDDPWLTGGGNTDRHLQLDEAYSHNELVGYYKLQDAVNEVIWKLDKVKKKKDDRDRKYLEWISSLHSFIGTIIIMSIEAVRFVWLGNDFYTLLMKPKASQRGLLKGESKLLNSWGSISACLDKDDDEPPAQMVQIVQPLTEEMVTKAETVKSYARSCIGVRQIKVRSEDDKVWLGRGTGVQQITVVTEEDEEQL